MVYLALVVKSTVANVMPRDVRFMDLSERAREVVKKQEHILHIGPGTPPAISRNGCYCEPRMWRKPLCPHSGASNDSQTTGIAHELCAYGFAAYGFAGSNWQ
jgi:hypothetical protein